MQEAAGTSRRSLAIGQSGNWDRSAASLETKAETRKSSSQLGEESGAVEAEEDAEGDRDGEAEPDL